MNKSRKNIAKFLCDYVPLIIFFIVYKFSKAQDPILEATTYLIAASFIAVIIAYILTKEILKIPLFSAIILGIFGGLTLFSGNDLFIKIKPTLINLIFAAILFYGYFSKKPLIGYLFEGNLKMSNSAWLTLSLRWAIFFVFLAIVNEIIWRNFSTDFWVNFKAFGMFPLTMFFTLSQLPFMIKNIQKE